MVIIFFVRNEVKRLSFDGISKGQNFCFGFLRKEMILMSIEFWSEWQESWLEFLQREFFDFGCISFFIVCCDNIDGCEFDFVERINVGFSDEDEIMEDFFIDDVEDFSCLN